MVEGKQSRPVRLFRKAFFEPRRTILAEAAPVTTDLERVEHQHAQRMFLYRILNEAGRPRNLKKVIQEGPAAVVIAHAEVDGDRVVPNRALQLLIGYLVISLVGQVPRQEQKVRPGLDRAQMLERLVQPAAIQLVGIVPLESQMNIGDLRDQHGRSLNVHRRRRLSWRRAGSLRAQRCSPAFCLLPAAGSAWRACPCQCDNRGTSRSSTAPFPERSRLRDRSGK